MNWATQQTANSHPEREPCRRPSGGEDIASGLAGASPLTSARAASASSHLIVRVHQPSSRSSSRVDDRRRNSVWRRERLVLC